jgi:Zn-dependent peptidase ImmA (M78 family)
MSDDYRVESRSNAEVRKLAKQALKYWNASNRSPVDIFACLRSGSIWTVRGVKQLDFLIRPDHRMGLDDAFTAYDGQIVTIVAKESVASQAQFGSGRPRNTLAHELGHGVMHEGPNMSRRALGNVTPGWLRSFESAEHQAKIFAVAFLVNDELGKSLRTPEDLSSECGISLEAARIYFEELAEARDREQNGKRLLAIAKEFAESVNPRPQYEVRYLDEPCTECGERQLFPVGNKFMCRNCNHVSDKFQDGDRTGTQQ